MCYNAGGLNSEGNPAKGDNLPAGSQKLSPEALNLTLACVTSVENIPSKTNDGSAAPMDKEGGSGNA